MSSSSNSQEEERKSAELDQFDSAQIAEEKESKPQSQSEDEKNEARSSFRKSYEVAKRLCATPLDLAVDDSFPSAKTPAVDSLQESQSPLMPIERHTDRVILLSGDTESEVEACKLSSFHPIPLTM